MKWLSTSVILELATSRWGQLLDDLECAGAQEVDPDGDGVALGSLRLLLEADHVALGVELGHAEAFGVLDAVEEGACTPGAGLEVGRGPGRGSPNRMLSPSTTQKGIEITNARRRPMAWAMPSEPRW